MPPTTKPRLSFDEIEGRVLAGAGKEGPGVRHQKWQTFQKDVLRRTSANAPRHVTLWQWAESVTDEFQPEPIICLWPRGGGKSTTVEDIAAYWGHTLKRKFVLYVCGTQDQADKHVREVESMLLAAGETRAVSEFGTSKGWKAGMLVTARGFHVVGIGLDVAMRGIKMDGIRPDAFFLDDIDELGDAEATRQKKVETLTRTILAASAPGAVVAFVQNLIYAGSIADAFTSDEEDVRPDFLHGAIIEGPEVAIEGLQYESYYNSAGKKKFKVIGGTPTWVGQDLATCETQMNQQGELAFLRESQHDIYGAVAGALWKKEQFAFRVRVDMPNGGWEWKNPLGCHIFAKDVPLFEEIAISLDPATTDKANSDLQGITVCARGVDKLGYLLLDRSGIMHPADAVDLVYRLWGFFGGVLRAQGNNRSIPIIYESNQGGLWVEKALRAVDPNWELISVHVHENKQLRAQPVSGLYKDRRILHVMEIGEGGAIVNGLAKLERQMTSWDASQPGKSPDRIDSAVMNFTYLLEGSMYATSTTRRYKK